MTKDFDHLFGSCVFASLMWESSFQEFGFHGARLRDVCSVAKEFLSFAFSGEGLVFLVYRGVCGVIGWRGTIVFS